MTPKKTCLRLSSLTRSWNRTKRTYHGLIVRIEPVHSSGIPMKKSGTDWISGTRFPFLWIRKVLRKGLKGFKHKTHNGLTKWDFDSKERHLLQSPSEERAPIVGVRQPTCFCDVSDNFIFWPLSSHLYWGSNRRLEGLSSTTTGPPSTSRSRSPPVPVLRTKVTWRLRRRLVTPRKVLPLSGYVVDLWYFPLLDPVSVPKVRTTPPFLTSLVHFSRWGRGDISIDGKWLVNESLTCTSNVDRGKWVLLRLRISPIRWLGSSVLFIHVFVWSVGPSEYLRRVTDMTVVVIVLEYKNLNYSVRDTSR